MRFSVRQWTVSGLLTACMLLFAITPLGLIPIGPLQLTTLHVPALVGALIEGPVVGAIVGLMFGLYSFFKAFTPLSPLQAYLQNPLVSVLPRVLFPVFAAWIFRAIKGKDTVRAALASGIGSILHTVMVLGMMVLIYGRDMQSQFGSGGRVILDTLLGVAAVNGVPECIIAMMVCTALVPILVKVKQRSGR